MKEAEHSLLKSEALFKALVQHSTDIFVLTNKNFRLNYVSDAVTRILGYYPDELKARQGFELIHTDDKESFAVWLAQLVDTPSGITPIEIRFKNSVGTWVYLEITGQNMLNDQHVAGLVINCRDIQASKIADQALIQAEQRLTLLLNNTKESFIILNNKLKVVAYNKAAQEHSPFFFRQELQSGLSFLELVNPAEAITYASMLGKVLEGQEQEHDTVFTDAAGKTHIFHHIYRLLNTGNDGASVFITSADVTEKWLAENALKESEEKFKTIIEYSFDAVIIINEQANVLYASPSIKNLIGYDPEEMVGRNGFEFIYKEDIPEVQLKLASILSNTEESYADYRAITKDGSLKWLEAKGKNMMDNKYINGVLVSLRDISQRKKMIEEQTALADELLKYNKDLQQFSFITSHNLRAPVANLMSLLSLYNREDTADPFNTELISKFDECISQLNETLNDLINVLVIRTKKDADIEWVRFEEVVQHLGKNVQSLLDQKQGKLTADFSRVEGIQYNRVHLESIFINLVSNSIKYSSPDRKLKINIRSEKTDKGVKLIFEDNGIGIDLARYGDRIFGLYQRFHASKEGKGLGLYMIKSQILASGGDIKVESKPGEGTSFIIHFRNREVMN